MHAGFQGNFDGGAGDFSVTHGGVAVADVEETSFYVHGKINRVADAGFGRIHVAAEFGGDDGAASLTFGGRDADAAEERMQRNLHGEIGVVCLKGGGVGGVIDVVVPDAFRQRRMQHGRVVGLIEGAEAGSEGADAGIAIDIERENLDGERVARLRAFNEKWAGQGIIALDHAEGVAGLAEDVAETIERVGIEDVAGLQVSDGLSGCEEVLHVGVGGGVVDGVLGKSCAC